MSFDLQRPPGLLAGASKAARAAGQVILEAAAARLVEPDRQPLRHDAGDTLLDSSFPAWADHRRDWPTLADGS